MFDAEADKAAGTFLAVQQGNPLGWMKIGFQHPSFLPMHHHGEELKELFGSSVHLINFDDSVCVEDSGDNVIHVSKVGCEAEQQPKRCRLPNKLSRMKGKFKGRCLSHLGTTF